MGGRREQSATATPDSKNDRRRRAGTDPGDGGRQLAFGAKELRHVLDLLIEPADHLFEVIDVVEMKPAPQGVMIPVLDQRMVDGHRVDAGGLHRHVRDLLFGQPRGGLDEHAVERCEHAFDGVPMAGAVPAATDMRHHAASAHHRAGIGQGPPARPFRRDRGPRSVKAVRIPPER